jgi:hypothetical protein
MSSRAQAKEIKFRMGKRARHHWVRCQAQKTAQAKKSPYTLIYILQY